MVDFSGDVAVVVDGHVMRRLGTSIGVQSFKQLYGSHSHSVGLSVSSVASDLGRSFRWCPRPRKSCRRGLPMKECGKSSRCFCRASICHCVAAALQAESGSVEIPAPEAPGSGGQHLRLHPTSTFPNILKGTFIVACMRFLQTPNCSHGGRDQTSSTHDQRASVSSFNF